MIHLKEKLLIRLEELHTLSPSSIGDMLHLEAEAFSGKEPAKLCLGATAVKFLNQPVNARNKR